MPSYFTTYSLDVEALVTWFPITSDASLKEPRMRGYASQFSNRDFDLNHSVGVSLGGGTSKTELAPNTDVAAFIDIHVTKDSVFEAEVELRIGGARRTKRLLLPANTRAPFMINLSASDNDEIAKGTAAVFQGVFTTSPLPSLLVEVGTIARHVFP